MEGAQSMRKKGNGGGGEGNKNQKICVRCQPCFLEKTA